MNDHDDINVQFDSGTTKRGPSCIQTFEDGRLLMVFTETDGAVSRLSGQWSTEEGESWDRPFPIREQRNGTNIGMPSLLRLPSGRLILVLISRQTPEAGQAMTIVSDDEGLHWSNPSPVTPDGTVWRFSNDSLLRLPNNRLVLPVLHDDLGCLTWFSDDEGITWRMGGGAVKPKEGETCCEPSMAELPNGRVAMFLRTSNRANQIYISSSENGESGWRFDNEWGPVSLNAPCLARRLPGSEDVLLLWNNHCLAANLTSAISRGPLRFWEHFRVIEEQDRWPGPTSYTNPSVAFLREQAHVTYVESDSRGAQRLIYRRFPIAWFRTGPPTRPMIYDARAYIRRIWEDAPADDPNHYIREFATATFNPADTRPRP